MAFVALAALAEHCTGTRGIIDRKCPSVVKTASNVVEQTVKRAAAQLEPITINQLVLEQWHDLQSRILGAFGHHPSRVEIVLLRARTHRVTGPARAAPLDSVNSTNHTVGTLPAGAARQVRRPLWKVATLRCGAQTSRGSGAAAKHCAAAWRRRTAHSSEPRRRIAPHAIHRRMHVAVRPRNARRSIARPAALYSIRSQ
eukprot:3873058-Prymnesium_polylepis.1